MRKWFVLWFIQISQVKFSLDSQLQNRKGRMKLVLLDFVVRHLLFKVAVLADKGIYVPRINLKKKLQPSYNHLFIILSHDHFLALLRPRKWLTFKNASSEGKTWISPGSLSLLYICWDLVLHELLWEQRTTCFDFWIYKKSKKWLLDDTRESGLRDRICHPFTKSPPQRDVWTLYEHGMNFSRRNCICASETLSCLSLQTRIYPLLHFLSTSNSAHPCRLDFYETGTAINGKIGLIDRPLECKVRDH